MPLGSYSDLKTAIANFLDRDDLASYIDDFIDLAEARHKREILIREMLIRAQASLSGRYLALPSRFVRMKTLRLLTSPVTVLTQLPVSDMDSERDERTGKPTFFSIHEEIEFDVTPDDDYTAEIIYYASFQPLDDTNTSNGLLVRAPDLYLYGALVASAPFLASDERIQTWESLYTNGLQALLWADRQSHYGTPINARLAGATP